MEHTALKSISSAQGFYFFCLYKWLVFSCGLSSSKHMLSVRYVCLSWIIICSKKARVLCIHSPVFEELICVLCSRDIWFNNNCSFKFTICIPKQSKREPERCELLPIFFLKGCEYWFLGTPQFAEAMSILALSNLFSICKSTCVSAQVT